MSKKVWRWLAPLLVVCLLAGAAFALLTRAKPETVQASVIGLPPLDSSSGYARVSGPRALEFPRDHGPHPDFLTEWWYYTGNLEGPEGRRFGFQLTFFRRALQPSEARQQRPSAWSTDQVYMGHFTLTDVKESSFRAFERFERGSAGLAGASGDPTFSVWLRDWKVEQTGPDTYRLFATEGDVRLELTLVDRKGIIMQGDRGYSQKGSDPGNASLYYSQTRLESHGTVTLGGMAYPVTGNSWMDREISTSALEQGQVGWDWFALQMDDGSELMAYVLRRADGSIDAFSSGAFISPNGKVAPLKRDDFQITVEDTWRSPHSGGNYPANWTVRVPAQNLELRVAPLMTDQELQVTVVYWEGAVRVEGTRAGAPVQGYGYVELTGYATSLEGGV